MRGAACAGRGARSVVFGPRSGCLERARRETQRTLSGSGCNMLEPYERRKPSRWCESTRAERDVQRVEPAHRRKMATSTGSGRSEDSTGGGGRRGRSPGEADRVTDPGCELARRRWRQAPGGRARCFIACTRSGPGAGRPRGPSGDAKGRGGSSEVPASCYCVRPDADPLFERAVCRSRASKGRPTPRVLSG